MLPEHSDGLANSKGGAKFLLALCVLGSFVGPAYSHWPLFVNPNGWGREAGEIFGAALGPALLPLIWWGVRRFLWIKAGGPLLLWIILIVFFGATSIAVKDYREAFAPTGCEFEVLLPLESEDKIVDASGQKIVTKEFYGKDHFLRAECMPHVKRIGKDRIIAILQSRAAADRLTNVQIKEDSQKIELTGEKPIQGRLATYSIVAIQGDRSIMFLTGGTLTKSLPHVKISEFFDSLKPIAKDR